VQGGVEDDKGMDQEGEDLVGHYLEEATPPMDLPYAWGIGYLLSLEWIGSGI
jgi:hypothetical protein